MLTPDLHPLPRTELEPVCPALAAVIRKLRMRAGLSLTRLAARTGLSRQMLSFIESQRRIPTVDTVARISRALGMPVHRLLARADRERQRQFAPRRRADKTLQFLAFMPWLELEEFFSVFGCT